MKMRPDTRSFSFTWMRGQSQKSVEEQTNEEKVSKSKSKENSDKSTGEHSKEMDGDGNGGGWGSRRGSSGSRLRKLGSSLVRLGGGVHRYTSIGELEDENNWQKISEEPIALDDDDDLGNQMDVQVQQVEVDFAVSQPKLQIPFKPLENGTTSAQQDQGAGSGLSLSKRLNKTVQDVKASLGNFSQRFRKSTRRRYRMGPPTPGSATSPTPRKILGRTPTKLYSPFSFESPISVKTPKRLLDRPSTPRLARKSMVSGLVYSPSNNFRRDLDEARRGMQDFQILSRDITRRSVRF